MNANPSLLSILVYIKSQIKDSGYSDVDTLEKNIHIHAYHEEYERCAEIRDVIQKLKNK